MELEFTKVMATMFQLFVLIVIGYVLNKKGILDQKTNGKLSQIVSKVACPALIIGAVATRKESGSNTEVFKLIISGFALYAILILLSFLVRKLLGGDKKKQWIYQLIFIFGNVSFLGFPLCEALYGKEAVFYDSLFHMPFNMLAFSLGVYFISKGNEEQERNKIEWKKMINAGVVSSILALLLTVTNIPVPAFIGGAFEMVGSMTTPLAMITIGSVLAGYVWKELLGDVRVYILAFLKLLVVPIAVYFVAQLIFKDPVILGMITLTLGTPCASIIVMLTIQNGNKEQIEAASSGVLISTLLSLITMPLLAMILNILQRGF